MVAQISQDPWVRACLAGIEEEPLSFHPFSCFFSKRALADSKAASIFLAREILLDYYHYAQHSPQSIIAGILAVRADLLLARRFSGVASNINACIYKLSKPHTSLAQAVYQQLWQHGYSELQHAVKPNTTNEQACLASPLTSEQCVELLQLLAKPQALAKYLFSQSPLDEKKLSAEKNIDEQEAGGDNNEMQAEQEGDLLAENDDSENLNNESLDDNSDTSTESKQDEDEPLSRPLAALSGERPYAILTKHYDRVLPATTIAPSLSYSMLKAKIAQEIPQYHQLSRRLANKLRRQLMSLQQHAWQDNLEEGVLHSAKLAAFIASPTSALPFRQEIQAPFPATAVTLLIDCSGSMQGKPLLMAAAWVDALVEALALCQIKSEVLGFTTGHWQDSPVHQQWQQQSGSEFSGRLNDLLHLEFKSFEQPWRKARQGLAAVLAPDWQKENIDGEALAWAYSRLAARSEHKKLLFVLSDAKPYDQATLENNHHNFLEQDLLRQVKAIQNDKGVELIGIGVGHRVCRIYPRSVQIKQLSELPQAMLELLVQKLQATATRG